MSTQFTGGYSRLSVPQISRVLEANNPHSISIRKDIHNAVNAVKHDKLGGLTNVEAAVEKLKKIS